MYLKMEGFHSAARANITEEQPGADGESIAQSEHVVFHWSSVCVWWPTSGCLEGCNVLKVGNVI